MRTDPVLALDPGKTTGWATYINGCYVTGQCDDWEVWNLLDAAAVDIIVYESFKYRTDQVHADLTPVEIIGVIKEWRRQNLPKIRHLVEQRPIDAKFYWTDKRLKDWGLYTPGLPHANDATRHLLCWQRRYTM